MCEFVIIKLHYNLNGCVLNGILYYYLNSGSDGLPSVVYVEVTFIYSFTK